MKTIILCGGKGTRLHEETEFKPKPMVKIGELPILVHIMKSYAFFGHKDFVLCLGHKGYMIKEYFLNLSKFANDFELDLSDNSIKHLNHCHNFDYKITFVETGDETQSGERLKIAALRYAPDDEFMVTYGDGVSNVDINKLIEFHRDESIQHGTVATISAVHPSSKYGKIHADDDHVIQKFDEKPILDDYINGGFMVFNKSALDYVNEGNMLEDGLARMAESRKLTHYKHDGFWHSMDTMKDVIDLNKIWGKDRPWAVWEKKKTQTIAKRPV